MATAGGAKIAEAETQAAQGALETLKPMRGEAYPYDQSQFDLWPLATVSGRGYVLGVAFKPSSDGRPDAPERFVEIAGAYLSAALGGGSAGPKG